MAKIDDVRAICEGLAGTTEEIKWGSDLCFCVAGKMYCVAVTEGPLRISLKVDPEEFEALCEREGFSPAPYAARYKWVLIEYPEKVTIRELTTRIRKSYQLVTDKLPSKARRALHLE